MIFALERGDRYLHVQGVTAHPDGPPTGDSRTSAPSASASDDRRTARLDEPSCVAPDLPTACGRSWRHGAVALYADLPATQYRDVAIAAALAAPLMDRRS